MRSQILRDVVAGCAGALLVLAIIGLPRVSASSNVQMQVKPAPARCTMLLPAYKTPLYSSNPKMPLCLRVSRPMPVPPMPSVPSG
jgi:hypothetical protein